MPDEIYPGTNSSSFRRQTTYFELLNSSKLRKKDKYTARSFIVILRSLRSLDDPKLRKRYQFMPVTVHRFENHTST
ncbi:uncharacterized protein M437DRAFT_89409 [Aureobasidium melanogenum CBS 110374]|uniref:Uncharacterized protein n=1 Tax=Aureobasidium melanogenum (strain CBS 110374) TaxID=1043003 RepID=A0A074VAT3_AURM1|nr:uncharacterized protein M437DRAFT_89409 [Aureobasidium melanogenum CBS 110374]KEQ57468.1 hypothetical protein M437DRAFT_89409 [Aureobasidium melanogenum CBS 110374]